MLDSVLLWAGKNEKRWLSELKQWLAIPSISAQPEHLMDVRSAAEWAGDYLRAMGMTVELAETSGNPVLFARTPASLCEPNAPHVILYGHYDVQPPEPLELWETPPFEPTVREGKVFARGASDDKGQVHCHMAALTAWKEINAKLPCNVTVIMEGEEEVGSRHLMDAVRTRAKELKTAKVLVISDSTQFAEGVPAITYGLRGLLYMEVRLKGAKTDLHSGMYGGAVANPAHALVEMLGQLHDENGRVTVPGFYDGVREITREERESPAKLGFSEEAYMKELGVNGLHGEAGYGPMERVFGRPTLEINGLKSGYQGVGAKTVLPCEALAKISCRLVPDQDPNKVAEAVKKYIGDLITRRFKNSVTFEVVEISPRNPPAITPIDSAAMAAAADAMEIGFGKRPVFLRDGGSIPVVTWFKDLLGVDTVMVGFGLPEDRIHAPNEKLDLVNYFGGIKAAVALWGKLGENIKG